MVSNTVQYDPLLVRYLAEELDARLKGRACTMAASFARDFSATLSLDGGEELRADLHPRRGWIRIVDASVPEDDLDAICTGVEAPPDERVLCIRLEARGRFRKEKRTLSLELPTNQWNAILFEAEGGRILNVLRPRWAGSRRLHVGQPYEPPPPAVRIGGGDVSEDEARRYWEQTISRARPEERRSRLLDGFAYTGSPNAAWLLAGGDEAAAFERWWWLRGLPPSTPCILHPNGRAQPYPVMLDGVEAEKMPSLLAAMAAVADRPAGPVGPVVPTAAESLVRRRIATTERKIERIGAQLAAAGEADRIRGLADLLLAQLHTVSRGQSTARLRGWDGEPVEIPLDPALSPAENAARLYDRSGRKKRAEERLPGLLAAAEREIQHWREAASRVARGEIPEAVAELVREGSARTDTDHQAAALPYRRFRTSGGLEVRAGRSSKDNDRLTFRESSPNDIWLHARSVPGSHVILRWPDPHGSPPGRDLEEASQVAAVLSRARTSGVVAVDWTRRKHVRKPRGSAPGVVVPQRVKTIFVEPDFRVVERMAAESLPEWEQS